MRQIGQLILLLCLGAVVAYVGNVHSLQASAWYPALTGTLLAIGLYGSTFGINLAEARQHTKIIVMAVTVGVLLKALFIGGILALIFQDPFYFILGILVAQIDPLSVAALLKGNRLSVRAKTILASWASFDDPVTVILALYVPALLAHITHQHWGSPTSDGMGDYLLGIGGNLGYALVVFAIWLLVRRHVHRPKPSHILIVLALLVAILGVAVQNMWMLSVAIIGLFFRPSIDASIEWATKWAFRLATLLLGVLMINGVDIFKGILLGAIAYMSQIVVGALLTRGLPYRDRVHIALAQQNGITAIILSLLFEPIFPGVVAIVAPAIVVINLLHFAVNALADRHLKRLL